MDPSEKIKVYDRGIHFTDDAQEIYRLRVGYRSGDVWAPQLDMTEALRVDGEHFVKCVESGQAPITDGHAGMRVVELIEAATSSMRGRGETVHLQRQKAVA